MDKLKDAFCVIVRVAVFMLLMWLVWFIYTNGSGPN
jgi:hypothetical protein